MVFITLQSPTVVGLPAHLWDEMMWRTDIELIILDIITLLLDFPPAATYISGVGELWARSCY